MVPLSFADQEWLLTEGHALYWPRENAVLVADLHLEKGSFFARHGQMVPPYDSRETLERVALAIRQTGARRVITLGDNFHDSSGTLRLEPHAAGMLDALTRSVDWLWITGNHDPDIGPDIGGTIAEEIEIGGIILRHQARQGETRPEVSGHYHPRLHMKLHNRMIRRPCTVVSVGKTACSGRMILPSLGAYTGGMDAGDPAIIAALQPADTIDAVVLAKGRLARFNLWQRAA